MTPATLYDLIAHPTFFHGCRVRVFGFLGAYQVSSARLYLSREDQVIGGGLFGAVYVSLMPRKASIPSEKIEEAVGKIVQLDGHFVDRGMDDPMIEDVEELNAGTGGRIHFPGTRE